MLRLIRHAFYKQITSFNKPHYTCDIISKLVHLQITFSNNKPGPYWTHMLPGAEKMKYKPDS